MGHVLLAIHASVVRSYGTTRPLPLLLRSAATAALLAAVLGGLRWMAPVSRTYPDTYWYVRTALVDAGRDGVTAGRESLRFVCADPQRRRDVGACVAAVGAGSAPARYVAIFDSRPGYPLLLSPFVWVFGASGAAVGTLLLLLLCGVLTYACARAAGLANRTSLAAEALFFILPTGLWTSRVLSESAVMAGVLTTLLGAALTHRGGHRKGAALVAGGLAVAYAAKPANGIALAVGVAGAGAAWIVVARLRRESPGGAPRSGILVVAICLASVAIWLCLAARFDLPGLSTTVQDLLTNQFTLPDAQHPVRQLAQVEAAFWPRYLRALVSVSPEVVAALAVGLAGLTLLRRPAVTASWVGAGASGLAAAVVHPVDTEISRLAFTIWLPVMLGLAAIGSMVLPGPRASA